MRVASMKGKQAKQAFLQIVGPESSLDKLGEVYPNEWKSISDEVLGMVQNKQGAALNSRVKENAQIIKQWNQKVKSSGFNAGVIKSALPSLVKAKLFNMAVREYFEFVATGKELGPVKLNFFTGQIMQRLFFRKKLERKPVSLFWFRMIWPWLPQKGTLLSLIQEKGIYCFYSKKLIKGLKELIGERSCLEIGAGDGTLSRFLQLVGVKVLATDDYSWSNRIDYSHDVENLDAKKALSKYQPAVVICSWPPAGNSFEKYVFKTKSVQCYIVIGGTSQKASGNWLDYKNQSQFHWTADQSLAQKVLPPEIGNAVLIFKRK